MARNPVQIDLHKLRREIRKLPNEYVYYLLRFFTVVGHPESTTRMGNVFERFG